MTILSKGGGKHMVNLSKQKFMVGAIQLTAPAAAMMLDKTFHQAFVRAIATHENKVPVDGIVSTKIGRIATIRTNTKAGTTVISPGI